MRIISRTEWGARPRKNKPRNCPNKQGIIIHHTYSPGNGVFSTLQNMKLQRGMQDYHMTSAGGTDIFQAFTVFQNGDVMEGREGGIFTDNGAARTWFEEYVGIENQGNFEVMPPTAPQMKSLMDLLVHICRQGVPPVIKGHYQMPNNSTSCPGKYMKNQLHLIQAELRNRLSSEEDDDMGKAFVPLTCELHGEYTYNVPAFHKSWWIDIGNPGDAGAEWITAKIFVNAQRGKTNTWGWWYAEEGVPPNGAVPDSGMHKSLSQLNLKVGKGNPFSEDWYNVDIVLSRPSTVMVGA